MSPIYTSIYHMTCPQHDPAWLVMPDPHISVNCFFILWQTRKNARPSPPQMPSLWVLHSPFSRSRPLLAGLGLHFGPLPTWPLKLRSLSIPSSKGLLSCSLTKWNIFLLPLPNRLSKSYGCVDKLWCQKLSKEVKTTIQTMLSKEAINTTFLWLGPKWEGPNSSVARWIRSSDFSFWAISSWFFNCSVRGKFQAAALKACLQRL